jgi:hypothetical protein
MPLDVTPLNELTKKLERELAHQDRLFQHVRESLAQLGSETRLHIPEAVLAELDAAFDAASPRTAAGPNDYARVRA